MAPPIRLQKLLAERGIASRRHSEALISTGQVRVNGQVVQELGTRVDPEQDTIEVRGEPLHNSPTLRYILLHKPLNVLSTCSDPFGRTTVLDLLPEQWRNGQALHPVGRLDSDSSGALLITNDGELTFQLTHPRHHQPKTYEVWVSGSICEDAIDRWRAGLILEGKMTLPARVDILDRQMKRTLLRITLVEGRNRQIRKVSQLLGYPVEQLHRVAIGSVELGKLSAGSYRLLRDTEVGQLRATGNS
ncbi:MAG: rRNA pseudouridine synthase [Anaerolineae bacterium]|nr:rRNA pseudouridine synthase [Gloeobacterales cyanobacterium ES-bin-313]